MKRILVSLVPFPIMAALAWLGGYNFDTRNVWIVYLTLVAIFVSAMVYFFPGWEE